MLVVLVQVYVALVDMASIVLNLADMEEEGAISKHDRQTACDKFIQKLESDVENDESCRDKVTVVRFHDGKWPLVATLVIITE